MNSTGATHPGLVAATARMRAAGIDERAVAVFAANHVQLQEGVTGLIPEATIEPLRSVTQLDQIEANDDERRAALQTVAVIKLNGGLGTSMGMSGPKSLVPVRDGLTFLDITIRQVLALREAYGVDLPLLFMNSAVTQDATAEALAAYPELAVNGLPVSFLQNMEPKLDADTLGPVDWPAAPDLEWCPPGHGDVYVSLASSGVLEALLERGYRYAFLSNGDNLGATCDADLAAWIVREGISYAAEVCERTANDRKGGHLAVRRADGHLVLRDSAAVAPGEDSYFQDNTRHTLFHANNLWVDLEQLARRLEAGDGVLGLPMIINRKSVDPKQPDSTPVIQIETAMGTAIEVFDGATAIEVPRRRFRPVKTTNELLLLRSDIFALDSAYRVVSQIDHPEPPISLARAYRLIDDFDARFPAGAPGLRECTSLRVDADLTFGAGVIAIGAVHLGPETANPIPDGSVLRGAG